MKFNLLSIDFFPFEGWFGFSLFEFDNLDTERCLFNIFFQNDLTRKTLVIDLFWFRIINHDF